MCFGGKPPKPEPLPPVEQPIDQAGQSANEDLRKRLRSMAGGYQSTALTGGGGVQTAANVGKTSLGA